jgi:hypothetical protein
MIVLYAKVTGPVVGVLAPVGPVSLPQIPPGRTFRLPIGDPQKFTIFSSDQLAAAAVRTTETDPLALFRYGVTLNQQVVPPEAELVKPLSGSITAARAGTVITGEVRMSEATGSLDVELWNAGGRLSGIRIPRAIPAAPFRFTDVGTEECLVLVPGYETLVVPK